MGPPAEVDDAKAAPLIYIEDFATLSFQLGLVGPNRSTVKTAIKAHTTLQQGSLTNTYERHSVTYATVSETFTQPFIFLLFPGKGCEAPSNRTASVSAYTASTSQLQEKVSGNQI